VSDSANSRREPAGETPEHSEEFGPHQPARAGRSPISPKGPLLCVDYGTKRIGLAVCDPDRIISSPLGTEPNGPGLEAAFRQLLARSKFVGVVVGLPLHASGEESQMSAEARKFARWIADLAKVPVVMWDERYTSHAAEGMLLEAKLSKKKRKARVDRVAAQMILQSFIDAGCPADAGNTILPGPPADSPDESSN
jgi:putative Holliday junction resolvase